LERRIGTGGLRALDRRKGSAIASMKLKHLDLKKGCVYQDAREVKTKFSKTFTTYFFPWAKSPADCRGLGEFPHEREAMGGDDPLFPTTEMALGRITS